jgi:dihydrofolate reductase
MRKIILNLAISLDGYICDENGAFDWIVGHGEGGNNGTEAYDFDKFLAGLDTIVMGSIAYEDVVLSGLTTFDDKEILVATHKELEAKENVEFISGDICSKIFKLKEVEGKNIWLFGGAGLTDSFVRENIVDEYVIAIIPTILGNGRRLFKGDYPKIDLHLDDYSVNDGIAVHTYSKRN